ncbi:vacuolar processing enzyme [Tribonema minus]|uniref:legumain n=1 Tax=Tribonema minus TaxID=303371 RepID=A0A835YZF5_9STRA|nr:vacuolar processing enzyme [Tribonema minus]
MARRVLVCASLLTIQCVFFVTAGETWAVVVAGSRYFYNYRHQADVCRAYHILRRNGVADDRVILMSYDDAATAPDNPVPGTLFNEPSPDGRPGWDVRHNCDIDYSGRDVTAEHFLAVLRGNATAAGGGPVLRSTAEDRVFVYFADHGAPGLIAMPVGEPVYADDFNSALKFMAEQRMFAEMALYVEACESGSMFEGLLPEHDKIWAITAANPDESSWGTYCDAEDTVNGVDIGTCLGDLFSINWMEDSDLPAEFHTETLDMQFSTVKTETTLSHVMFYGDRSLNARPITEFQGVPEFPSLQGRLGAKGGAERRNRPGVAVDSRDVKLHTLRRLQRRSEAAGDVSGAAAYAAAARAEETHRAAADRAFAAIAGAALAAVAAAPLPPLAELACHKRAHRGVTAACGPYSDYSLKHARVVAVLCESGYSADAIIAAADAACAAHMPTSLFSGETAIA